MTKHGLRLLYGAMGVCVIFAVLIFVSMLILAIAYNPLYLGLLLLFPAAYIIGWGIDLLIGGL